jgi:hypothetical protein
VVQSLCERYICHGAEILCVVAVRSGFIPVYKAVLSAGAKVEDPPTGGDEIPPWRGKNRDKPIKHTVRVMLWRLFIVKPWYF